MKLSRVSPIRSLSERQTSSETIRLHNGGSGFIRKLAVGGNISFKTCQYIRGEHTKMDYRVYGVDKFKCGAPAVTGSPYCQECHSRCYTKILTPASDEPSSQDAAIEGTNGNRQVDNQPGIAGINGRGREVCRKRG